MITEMRTMRCTILMARTCMVQGMFSLRNIFYRINQYHKSTILPPVTQLFSVMPCPIGLRIGMGVLWCLTQVLTWPFFDFLPLST